MAAVVTMADLRRVDSNGTSSQGFLHCEACGAEYSANPGDYWDHPMHHVFKCCDEPMQLVKRVSRMVQL